MCQIDQQFFFSLFQLRCLSFSADKLCLQPVPFACELQKLWPKYHRILRVSEYLFQSRLDFIQTGRHAMKRQAESQQIKQTEKYGRKKQLTAGKEKAQDPVSGNTSHDRDCEGPYPDPPFQFMIFIFQSYTLLPKLF